MTKILSILMVIAISISILGCAMAPVVSSERLFETVAEYKDCTVKRHKETNVLYVDDGYGVSVLLNADGTPMIWEGN